MRGVLDTSTLILLRRIPDAGALPAEPLITAVTLAELAVGPLVARGERSGRGVRPTSSRPRPISSPCPSTSMPRGRSGRSRRPASAGRRWQRAPRRDDRRDRNRQRSSRLHLQPRRLRGHRAARGGRRPGAGVVVAPGGGQAEPAAVCCSSRTWFMCSWTKRTTVAPSPTAVAQRLIEPERTSPAA